MKVWSLTKCQRYCNYSKALPFQLTSENTYSTKFEQNNDDGII